MVANRPRVALVSREVAPFGGGGIGRYVSALADLLGGEAEVTIFTTDRHRRAHRRLRRARPESLPRAPIVFVREPRSWDARSSFSVLHAWSARVHEALLREYGGAGPELVEFPDFLGEGCVTVQAKRTGSTALASTAVCVRAHGTAEIYDVLNGFLPAERERAFTYELERYALRYADHLLWAGGDILGALQRFYGAEDLAPARIARHPFAWETDPPAPTPPHDSGPLRLLYIGRLERRKGVRELIDSLLGIGSDDWRLTMVGADTETAPLGGSMRALLELELAGDPRVRLVEPVPRDQIPSLIDAHDALVVPSRWECWPYAALEALDRGRPLLATPTGGLTEIAADGTGGWLAADGSRQALSALLSRFSERPQPIRDRELADRTRRLRVELTDPEAIRETYRELCGRARSPQAEAARSAGSPPLVSVVIPYFELEAEIGEAVASVAAQTYPRTELIVINDGSLRSEDAVLFELQARYPLTVITQPNSGLGAARNLGVAVSRGDYVLPLDADNSLAPEFVARCVAALEADPEIAYATSWLRYIDQRGRPWKGTEEGLRPLGNSSRAVEQFNVAGDACAVLRRSVFDSGLAYSTDVAGFEDWTLYREMRRAGLIGHVIPEPLIDYRLRSNSMMRALSAPREAWIRQAIDAHLIEHEVRWTAPS